MGAGPLTQRERLEQGRAGGRLRGILAPQGSGEHTRGGARQRTRTLGRG